MGVGRRIAVAVVGLAIGFGFVAVDLAEAQGGQNVKAAPGTGGSRPWSPGGGRLPLILFFDDGTFESGLGWTDYNGQWNVAFGGGPLSTGAVPFQITGAFWFIYPGFPGLTNAVFNVHATPNSQIFSSPAPGGTGTNSFFGSGPVVTNPGGSVVGGVGGSGPSIWFIGADTNGAWASRNWGGMSPTGNLCCSPTYWNTVGFPWNWLIRLQVDGNIPVELESFDIE